MPMVQNKRYVRQCLEQVGNEFELNENSNRRRAYVEQAEIKRQKEILQHRCAVCEERQDVENIKQKGDMIIDVQTIGLKREEMPTLETHKSEIKEKKTRKKGIAERAGTLKKKSNLINRDNALYNYNGRCYEVMGEMDVGRLYLEKVDKNLDGDTTTQAVPYLYKFLKFDPDISVRDEQIYERLVVLENGVYDVERKMLFQHSPDIIAFSCVNARYVEQGRCDRFDTFLEEVTGGDSVLIERLWMFLGYVLMQTTEGKVFFVMGVAPDSGKSLLGHFIESLFPAKYISNVALNDFNREFSLSTLVGASINISLDLPSSRLNPSAVSRLKMLTGGDAMNLNQKYVNEFRYRNRAKFIFATNSPIQLAEDDEAFWNRMILLPFDYSVSKAAQNTNLLNELLEEKDAIVSKALKYARKLIKNNYEFPTTPDIEKRIRQWRGLEIDSISEFIARCCYVDTAFRGELMEDLHAEYLQFCADIDVEAVTRATFKRYLEKQVGLVHFKMRRENTDNPQSAFKGILLRVN